MSNEQRVHQLGLTLPEPAARGSYLPARLHQDVLHLSGNGPLARDKSAITGVVGADISVATAQEAARLTAINLLGVARASLGSLDRVTGVLSVLGYIRSVPEFGDHPAVIDPCSELLVSVFGDAGQHARAAIGVASLPFGLCVEISAVLSVRAQ